jgi:hypothetical protein
MRLISAKTIARALMKQKVFSNPIYLIIQKVTNLTA